MISVVIVLSLTNDVGTRWNSLFLLMKRLLLRKNAVRLTLMNTTVNAQDLTNTEWDLLEAVAKFLEPFDDVL